MASLLALSPYGEDRCLRAIVETPKGSHCKYAYDPDLACLTLRKLMPEGMVFPYDFKPLEDVGPKGALKLLDAAMRAFKKAH